MSAFLVGNTTINKIITIIRRQTQKSEWFKSELASKLNIDFIEYGWETKLGQKMFDLNQLALKYRYGDRKQPIVYKYQSDLWGVVESYKALQCWLYQCCEGEIPEKSKLYKVFDEFIKPYLANAIVTSMSEYDNAEWG